MNLGVVRQRPQPAPYPGLRSFRRSEFGIFFGRTTHVADMLAKLAEHGFLCVTGPSGCGKSSLARTGLFNSLEAGFLSGRGSDWIFCDTHPETDPLNRLCDALATAIVLGESGPSAPEPDVPEAEDISHLSTLFHNHVEERSSNLTGALEKVRLIAGRPIMILIDQFEEIFRYAQDDPEAASRFVDVLLKTAAAQRDVYVVITIRTDELAKCARYAGLARAINESQFLTPTLDRFQMQEAIEGPATLFDATIDPRLSAWMLNGLEEELDKLPLMQHALRLLYRQARQKVAEGHVTIGLEDFFDAFEIPGAREAARSGSHDALRTSLSQRLDTLYSRLPERDRRIARALFCALTATESRDRDIRRPVRLGEAMDVVACGFDDLVRVISVFKEGSESYLRIAGEHDGIDPGDTVDVTHECILRLWRSLQEDWLPEEAHAAENVRFLAQRAHERAENLRGGPMEKILGSGLLSGPTLDRYRRWWQARRPNAAWAARYLDGIAWTERGAALSSAQVFARIDSFVTASAQFRSYKIAGLVAAGVIAVVAAGWGVRAQTAERIADAQEKTRQAIAERLASLNPSARSAYPMEVAEEATELLSDVIAEAVDREALARETTLRALNFVHERRRFDHGPGGGQQVYAAAFLPGGRTVATLTAGLDLVIWDTARNSVPARTIPLAPAQSDPVSALGRSLAVAPDGTVAVGTQRGAVLLVEELGDGTGAEIVTELYPGRDTFGRWDSIMKVAFSADGRRLAAASLTGHVHSWQRDTRDGWGTHRILTTSALAASDPAARAARYDGQEIFPGNLRSAWSVALSRDGALAAVGLGDGRVCVFESDGLRAACRSGGHTAPVKALGFAPSGDTLLSGGNDDTLRIWELGPGLDTDGLMDPELSPVVLWQDSDVWDLAFDGTGELVATATWDGTVQVYRTDRWRPLRTLRGHEQTLRTVAFAPDGTEVVTASLDHTARIWTPFSSRLADYGLATQVWLQHPSHAPLSSAALGQNAAWVAATDRKTIWLRERDAPLRQLHPHVRDGRNGNAGGALPSALAAPAARDLLVAAMRPAVVRVWERGGDGDWHARVIPLTGKGAGGTVERRAIAVSADGTRFAAEVLGTQGTGILVCAVDAATCSSDPGGHVAFVPYASNVPAEGRCRDTARLGALALSSDGRLLAAGGTDCMVRFWTLAEDRPVAAPALMADHVGNILALDISEDGGRVAASSADWTASVWTPGTGDVVRLRGTSGFRGHRSSVDGVQFAPSGRHAITVSADERMIVWDTATGEPFLEYSGFDQSLNAVDVKASVAGVRIATANNTGDVIVQPFFGGNDALLDFARGALDAVLGTVSAGEAAAGANAGGEAPS